MKFLIDECIGREVFNWFVLQRYDALFVRDLYRGADDDWVLEKAVQEHRVLVTCDKDFGDMIFRDQKIHKGIILLRTRDESADHRICILQWILEHHKDVILNNFLLATDSNIRIVPMH